MLCSVVVVLFILFTRPTNAACVGVLNEIAAAQLLGSRGSRILGQLCLWNCVGRMPPRNKIELALLVLRAFPALRAALWTCSEQPKVWCRRSSWKAQKEYSKFTKIQIYAPNSFLCIYPLRTPKAALFA